MKKRKPFIPSESDMMNSRTDHSGTMRALEAKGLIQKKHDANGNVVWEITEAGRQACEQGGA
jgi:DNA-binding MarR family transcriptional regulator